MCRKSVRISGTLMFIKYRNSTFIARVSRNGDGYPVRPQSLPFDAETEYYITI